jgi:hypothetical protein
MLRVVKFVQMIFLKLNPICENEEWYLVSYSNSNWVGNPETRISVTGLIICLIGAPICWTLKEQEGVTMSSSEAECIAIVREHVKDGLIKIIFVKSIINDADMFTNNVE